MAENTKGSGYGHKDSRADFEVRHADEHEAREAAQKLKDDTDARIARLRPQADQMEDD